ncbi:MAG: hypothetical protein CO028_02000 [Candidatus Levybacteria bacterium CG_4_9_14_0_2_um_filter_35_21]|nr:MAG: hypothetical protein COW87_02665 [Candidatus Levybacteria bacterium CG22_combo_CG10-13_8_21_14_all_35_11]PJC54522.1 MAG: hypothetical protein CO028_02000 [Candidatus Levybacteria bacterium CG_4_9_14_0_2_um_filter_35_21]
MKKYLVIFFIFMLLLLPLISLFHSGLPHTHDGQDHVARIANFYQNLSEGNIIPRWGANLNWGYGHPILEFLYPAPSYFASFFHFFGFSFVDSIKIVFGLGMVLSGVFMYLWLSSFLAVEASLVGAVLYMYAPYRFIDLNVRGAIGENFVFIWLPLVLYFIYKLYKTKKISFIIPGGIALALLILSHNAISLMFLPFIIFYGIYLSSRSKNLKFYFLGFTFLILLGFILSAFFWFPALVEGKYTLRNIVTAGGYLDKFVNLNNLIYGKWNYGISGKFMVQLGLTHWLGFIASPFAAIYFFRKRNKLWIFTLALFIYILTAILLMLPESNFIWSRVPILQNFQFPWRFLAATTFATAVLGAVIFSTVPKKFSKYLFIAFCLLILFLSKDYFYPKAYLQKPETFYTGVYNGTTDTGESAPIWSIRFMEKRPKAHLEVIDGNASKKEIKRTSTYHEYLVSVKNRTLFSENTLYFPGWEIRANDKSLQIQYQNMAYRGIMLFSLDSGDYKIKVQYKETKLRAFADAISIVAIFNILGFYLFKFVKKRF